MVRRTRGRGKSRDSRRVAGAVGLLGLTAALGARAASGAFLASSKPETDITAGTLSLTVADGDTLGDGTGIQAFDVDMLGMRPADSYYRIVNTTNGSVGFTSLSLAITCVTVPNCNGGVNDAITNATSNGMIVKISRCSAPWTRNAGASPYESYLCNAPATETLITNDNGLDGGFDPLLGTFNPSAVSNLAAGGVNHYRFVFKLSDTATDAMQGETGQIRVTFNGTQRAGTNK